MSLCATREPSGRNHLAAGSVAALIMSVVGASTFNILPLLTAGAAHALGFSERQVGTLSLTICVGSATSALLAGMWVRSVNWTRAAQFALGGMLVTNALSMLVHQFWAFAFLQGSAGFFSAAVFCLALTILSDRPQSARNFGLSNAMQVVYQVIAILAGPTLLGLSGLSGVLMMIAAPSGLAILLVPLLPTHGRRVEAERVAKALFKPATLIALTGFCIFFINAGAYWTYVEIMGEARGMTSRVVANCVAAGVSAGVLGGALAWAVGDRFGRFWPLCGSCFLTIVAGLLLSGSFGVASLVVSVTLYFFAWNYAVAYQLSIINAVDATGRGVAITQAFAFLGAAAGAGVAASLVTPGDYHAVIWLVVSAVCVSTGLFALVTGRNRGAEDDRLGKSSLTPGERVSR